MKATYDPLADAVSITFKKGKVAETKEITSDILLDLDKKGTPLYLEILDASKKFKKNSKKLGGFVLEPLRYSKRELAALSAK